jgi:hypothetical protein
LTDVLIDGRRVPAGADVELTPSEALTLMMAGKVEPARARRAELGRPGTVRYRRAGAEIRR